jgi:hypothetical protein
MTTPPLPSETVRWQGRPGSYPVFVRSDAITLPFGVVFLGVVGWFFVWPAWRDHSTIGIIATTIFGGCALQRGRQGRRAAVDVAHRRVPLVEHGNGLGSITFGKPLVLGPPRGSRPKPGQTVGLEQIPNARAVRDTIAAAQTAAPKPDRLAQRTWTS